MQDELIQDKACSGKLPNGDDCNSMHAQRATKILKMPDVVIIQLKRFSHDGRWQTKIHKKILADPIVKMGKYMEHETETVYQLYSVINHYGGST